VTVHDDSDEVPSRAAAALTWVIREGVTNVVRHSGARHCAIAIVTADGRTTVELRDDGPPRPAPVFGNGLRGLAERLARDGGTLDAGPVAGGFALTATVPIGGAG
jgi:two-component system sensor histidine kinase DesK